MYKYMYVCTCSYDVHKLTIGLHVYNFYVTLSLVHVHVVPGAILGFGQRGGGAEVKNNNLRVRKFLQPRPLFAVGAAARALT